jgi:hypothetical protein
VTDDEIELAKTRLKQHEEYLAALHRTRDVEGYGVAKVDFAKEMFPLVPRLIAEVEKLRGEKAMLAETMHEAVKRYVTDEKEVDRMRPVYEAATALVKRHNDHRGTSAWTPEADALYDAVGVALAKDPS